MVVLFILVLIAGIIIGSAAEKSMYDRYSVFGNRGRCRDDTSVYHGGRRNLIVSGAILVAIAAFLIILIAK